MRFEELVGLCERLEGLTKRGEMVELVASFLQGVEAEEVEPAVLMLLGRPFPKWSQRALEVSWRTLWNLIKRLTGVKPLEFRRAFDRTGDLGEATKLVWSPSKIKRQATLVERPLTILEVERAFKRIAGARGPGARERKERILEVLLGRATPSEAKYLVKIAVGEMRTGFQEGLLELAIARAFGLKLEQVQRACMFAGDVAKVAGAAKVEGERGVLSIKPQVFRPILPMLAQNVEGVQEALELHGGKTAFEHKLDGARVQIHKLGQEVRIYSRRLSDVTPSLPELVKLVRERVRAKEAILEGEVVALGKEGIPMPFQYLMQRFRRKQNLERAMREVPLELRLFDLLLLEGESLVDMGYLERRRRLGEITDLPLTEQLITSSSSEAERFLKEALGRGHEGLMAKELESPYTPGVRGKKWLKLKPVLEPLDLVIVAAEFGHGRRHAWLSDYYLAARDPETGEFLVVGKTFKGLTDEEIVEMTQRLKELSLRREGRKVVVKPEVVVEVAYNEIQRSPKYKCGMALRFARITRIREDKGPEQADTIQKVREIYRKQIKRHA